MSFDMTKEDNAIINLDLTITASGKFVLVWYDPTIPFPIDPENTDYVK